MLDLVEVPAGTSCQGSDRHYPEERPAREVQVEAFRVARTPTTVEQFAAFVDATGYLTRAERDLGGSAVFTPPRGPVDLRDPRAWWTWVTGASWRAPDGPGSDVTGREQHPVVHVVLEDARAFAAWAGLRLPHEREWEHAALGGQPSPGDGAPVDAVVWRGEFPWRSDGPAGTRPVGTHPPNGYGLLDVLGNAWELVDTAWSSQHAATSCCAPPAPDAGAPGVAKGGSFLCASSYCARYRPAARIPVAADSPTAHVGFRCAGPSPE